MSKSLNYAVVTVSDSCSSGTAVDTSGPNLISILKEKFNAANIKYEIVPDDSEKIKNCLLQLVSQKVALVLTTGGTGFSPRDVTPEATRMVIQKEAPGLSHAMMGGSLKITPYAMLSRSVCGICESTLIINLPGSQKASQECFEMIEKALHHGLSVLQDIRTEVKITHQKMQTLVSLNKQCHHHCKVSVDKIAYRLRTSPYPMISVTEANDIIREVLESGSLSKEVDEITERLHIDKCLHRVLAEDVFSKIPLPPFRASIKDGYAAIALDGIGVRTVVDGIGAGDHLELVLEPGQCARINTGAVVPNSADCVIQVEDTKLTKHSEDGTKEFEIEVMAPPTRGQDIREIGSDLPENTLILTSGVILGAAELGLLASIGANSVNVYTTPIVGVLSTGNELQSCDSNLKPGHIYDSNKIMLMSLLKENNIPAVDLGIVHDNYEEMSEALKRYLGKKCDIMITTGCVSMGDKDILKQILQNDLGATIHFGRVNMKPGKPTTFASCSMQCAEGTRQKFVFALPGNPVSAFVTFHVFVLPHLKRLANHKNVDLPVLEVELGMDIELDPRPEYARAYLTINPETNSFLAYTTGNQISSRLASVPQAGVLLELPKRTNDKTRVQKGERVNAIVLKIGGLSKV